MADETTAGTGGLSSIFGGDSTSSRYRPIQGLNDSETLQRSTPEPAPAGADISTIPGYNYGDTSGRVGSSYIPWYDQKAMLDQNQAGPTLLGSDRTVQTEFNNGEIKDTGEKYNWTDELNNYWNKYKKYFQFGMGAIARMHPGAATAYGLYNLFNNPRGAVAGQAGGALGSVVGGAINPALSGVGGQVGSQMAQGAAANAEKANGVATNAPAQTTSRDPFALGAGLGQIYNRYNTSKEYGTQGKQLQDLYGPNSAYAKQLEQTLMRQDAAAGRRSQYGARSVELQARLADLASRNAPQLQQLTRSKSDERNKMYTDLYSLGRGLYDIM
jgi:hypothetical protein